MSSNGIDFAEAVTLVNDPEPRISQAGGAWCTFRVAYNPRIRDKQTGEWSDGDATYFGVRAFGKMADKICATFTKGDQAIILGRWGMRAYTDNQGAERVSLDLTVDEIGASVKFAEVRVSRTRQGHSGGSVSNGTPQGGFGSQNSDTSAFGGGSSDFDQPF